MSVVVKLLLRILICVVILVDQLLLLLLDSESRDLVYSSCGVLINLTADHMYRSILPNNAAVGRSVIYVATLYANICVLDIFSFIFMFCVLFIAPWLPTVKHLNIYSGILMP